ncbi:MAG: hypothetical protein KDE48_15100 [Anaerolineales bacterium]|nr:hypothetical protein [Anaerolineales bacterium]
MATQEFNYKGRHIVINVAGEQAQMTIDGEAIPVGYDSVTGTAVALIHQPFESHASLSDLAIDLVDNVINKRM